MRTVAVAALFLITVGGCASARPTVAPRSPEATVRAQGKSPSVHDAPFEALTGDRIARLEADIDRPNGSTWLAGTLYTACSGDGTIYEIDSATGQTRAYIYGVRDAHSLYAEFVDDALELWVPDYIDNSLKHVRGEDMATISHGLNGPWGIAYLSADSFLVSSQHDGKVRVVSRRGTSEVVVEGLQGPTGIAVDLAQQFLYVANGQSSARALEWYNLAEVVAGNEPPESHALIVGLESVTGVQLAPDGGLYFAYADGDVGLVGRVDAEYCRAIDGCKVDDVEVVLDAGLAAPLAGLTIAEDMRLFVHTAYGSQLIWAQIDG